MQCCSKSFICLVKAPLLTSFAGQSDTTMMFKIILTQLPPLVNNATTGHKLQGQTKKICLVCQKNWNHVAISRVMTRSQLFLVSPLPSTVDFFMSTHLTQMLHTLHLCTPLPIDSSPITYFKFFSNLYPNTLLVLSIAHTCTHT